MIFLAASAALVGFLHSLAPGHWLPVVLLAKSRRWDLRTALLGAFTAASGHILISILVGAASLLIGSQVFDGIEEDAERWGAYLLIGFGVVYALVSYFRHSHCHGHTHHGPDPRSKKAPFLFLFSIGFSPCIAALPVFGAAAGLGSVATLVTMAAFAGGVLMALGGATVLVSKGVAKLDHPWLEHHGDLITGLAIVLMGTILFLFPHAH